MYACVLVQHQLERWHTIAELVVAVFEQTRILHMKKAASCGHQVFCDASRFVLDCYGICTYAIKP